MNDAIRQPDRRLRPLIYILLCSLGYLAVVTTDYLLLKHQVIDWRSALAVLFSLSVITVMLTLVGLFRPFQRN